MAKKKKAGVGSAKPKPPRKNKPITIEGKFISNANGYGFVECEGADVFIPPGGTAVPPSFVLGALHGDIVTCRITKDETNPAEGKHSRTGEITTIIKRATHVGTYFTDHGAGVVRPIETKIPYTFPVTKKNAARFGLTDGHRVVFGVDKKGAIFITEVLGHMNDPGVDILSLVIASGVPHTFPEDVNEEADAIPTKVYKKDIKGRLDLRAENIFTIDGEDTKDIDDAISFEPLPGGNIRLGVHIADVSHYVKKDTALDRSALNRGTSIYLADRVIPMLPHKLSSGICSLFPGVDRLTLSCIMIVNPKGNVLDYEMKESVIHSKRRWTYEEVQEILESPAADENWAAMDNLREVLFKKREKQGALDFNIPESKVIVDEQGKPISIELRERTRATGIIEEFMILCNETIATHFLSKPFIYRTHEKPTAEKLANLGQVTERLGFKAPKTADNPKNLQKLLAIADLTEASATVSRAVLQSLPQANYTTDTPTHFGLASRAYCHFTSPIRRYADLEVHRIVKAAIKGKTAKPKGAGRSHGELLAHASSLVEICARCSYTERRAETLEREVLQLKKVEYMAGHKGEILETTISGITSWGVFATTSHGAEGLIPYADLKRHGFKFNKDKNMYYQTNEAPALYLGKKITIVVADASVEDRKITFSYYA